MISPQLRHLFQSSTINSYFAFQRILCHYLVKVRFHIQYKKIPNTEADS